MSYFKKDKRAYILLEDGTLFEGYHFGCEGTAIGEMVFTTGMTGYQEVLTDPSYYGQIVMQTYLSYIIPNSPHSFYKCLYAVDRKSVV